MMINSKLKKIAAFLTALCVAASVFAEVKVVSVNGKCEYENNGVWTPVTVGMSLSEGTKIQTGFKSEMVLSLVSKNENSKLTVAQLSRMTIDQLISSDKMDKTNISLTTGSIKSEINRTGNVKVNYTIKSPVATASVRGTITEYKNTVQAVEVTTFRGWTSVWPSDLNNDENLESAEEEIIFPSNGVDVKKYQQTEVSNNQETKDPIQIASGKATGKDSVQTAAEGEVNSLATKTETTTSGIASDGDTAIKLVFDWQ